MKKTLLAAALFAAIASSAGAADVVEAVIVRVGDRIITRSQYTKRLADLDREIEQTSPPGAGRRAEATGACAHRR